MSTEMAPPATSKELAKYLTGPEVMDRMAQVAAEGMDVDRMVKQVAASLARNPSLAKCSRASIINCMVQAAELGLTPTGGGLGHAYLVPYKDAATLQIGYRGFVTLARRSGQIAKIEAVAVHKSDPVFAVMRGTKPDIQHELDFSADRANAADIIAYYATATFRDGTTQFEVMSPAEVARIRARSRASGSGPWVTDEVEMGKKTVVRRLAKMLPLETKDIFGRAVALDEENEMSLYSGDDTDSTPVKPRGIAALRPKAEVSNSTHGDALDAVFSDAPEGEPAP